MLYKETKLWISDNSGATTAKCIQLYKTRSAKLGSFVKTVLHKFDTKKKLAKKKKYLSLVISSRKKTRRLGGTFVAFSENRGLLLADREKFLGSRIYGPIAKELQLMDDQFKKYKALASAAV